MKLLDLFKKKIKTNTSPNTAVFTTKQVINEKMVITRVYHSLDNTLQFHDEYSTNSNANIMIVSLKQILERDPSVIDAVNMPVGYCARRKNINDIWIIETFEEEEGDE
jgi:hypothetical protein